MANLNQIKDRATITDHVHDWMHAHARDMSIDTLLTWPDKSAEMGRAICRRMGRKATPEAIHEICRAALSSRKRGDLKRDKH